MDIPFIKRFFGSVSDRELARIKPIVSQVNALEPDFKALSDAELAAKTISFRERLAQGATLEDILPEAFAAVREASRRTLGQRHFDVQIIGGVVMHEGKIAEMRTGEGKTLVATLPAYLNALAGGVHVITVNDYLSRRDAVWMGQIYDFLGLSVGIINNNTSFRYDPKHTEDDAERDEKGSFHVEESFLRPVDRAEAYRADIVYGTNSEFGFDYLRDNLEYSPDALRQRELSYAIVDEIDSILIDEARTPLIISAPTADSDALYKTFASVARSLKPGEHYEVDEKLKAVSITQSGIDETERILGIPNLYAETSVKLVHHLETSIKAEALYRKDKEYVVKDGEVVIVDEFTGRLQPGRRWSEGLHQAIEAKEGVDVQKESRTYASITYQNYFRMYKKLGGMTGTAETSAEEFYKVYGIGTVVIPTNRAISRIDRDDLIYQNEKGKFAAIAKKVKALNEKGQPVLIGTASIQKNELLSDYLSREGVKHEVLNAKNHAREGEIIAQAGRKGAVTIATNMAGRGVDIKLGGNPQTDEAAEEIRGLGGLFVLGTERHEARRIDNQLRGRSGRQGDPGETQFYVSLEDNLMRVFAGEGLKSMMGKLGVKDDQPIENRMVTRALEKAQERIEGFHFDARKHTLQYDDVLNLQRTAIYAKRRSLLMNDREYLARYAAELEEKADDETSAAMKAKRAEIGDEEFLTALRMIALQSIDMFWVDHLEMMDHLRGSVNLRALGQRDPLVEYKKEGLRLFRDMELAADGQTAFLLGKVTPSGAKVTDDMSAVKAAAAAITATGGKPLAGPERNDPCPCGSGKKWKKCGMVNAPEHLENMKRHAS
jgi:preprotein translocase subunit SecA